MTPGTALVLLGFGLGAWMMAIQSTPQTTASPRERADDLRTRAIEAQRRSAIASQVARDLTSQWITTQDGRRGQR